MVKYTMKSIGSDGVHYLVNGWHRPKLFWLPEDFVISDTRAVSIFFFNTPAGARASLTKLLKVMPEYANNKFELAKFQ